MSPGTVVDCLMHLHGLDAAALGASRTLLLSGLTVSMAEIAAALEPLAGDRNLGRIEFRPDPAIERIVAAWPTEMVSTRAQRLGFPRDAGIEEVIRAYLRDHDRRDWTCAVEHTGAGASASMLPEARSHSTKETL